MNTLRFWLNGEWIEENNVPPTTTLLQYLRNQREQKGTKEGCAEGDCGACTVVVMDLGHEDGPRYRAINSCLVLLPMMQGKHVLTVEALEQNGRYHIVQESLVQELGSQCGYCTPGFIMTMFEACYRKDLDEAWKLDDQLCGNLCRCTGYRPILEAAEAVAGLCPDDWFSEQLKTAEPESMSLSYMHGFQQYFNPVTLGELWDLLDEHLNPRFVVGGTDLSLEITKQFKEPELLISLEGIPELSEIREDEDGWRFGATVSIARLEEATRETFPSIERMARFFGARQIKNRGTLGGNICTASPIGDMAPVMISLGAVAVLLSRQGERRVPLESFFTGYRQTALNHGEILAAIEVPHLPGDEVDVRTIAYKVSKRQELDISTVSSGFYVHLDKQGRVFRVRLAYGGMAATPMRALNTEMALIGQPWDEDTIESVLSMLEEDFTPLDDHRGSAWYRMTVAKNLLRGFVLETAEKSCPRLSYRPSGTVDLEVSS
jgi:xanthine dehydrogenase small subunit